jgi:phosphoribosylformylglycinamidine synthase
VPGEDKEYFATVKAVGAWSFVRRSAFRFSRQRFAVHKPPQLDKDEKKQVIAPVSLGISAFAPVQVRARRTHSELSTSSADSELILIDLGAGKKNRLVFLSALAQVWAN